MIGVFDSGFGGLAILKEFLKNLPEYDYIYLGDNARAPYGNRSHEVVKTFTKQGVDYLFSKGCGLIIIACNTASSNVLRELQEEYLRQPKVTNRKILGVIIPLAEAATALTKNGRIGVVATQSTIQSKTYETEIHKLNKDLQIYTKACPLLVPLIEEGWSHRPETRIILRKYLYSLKTCNIDTLILGCTHYPFLIQDFCRIMGKKVNIPNPGEIVAKSLKNYLSRHPEIEKILGKKAKRQFFTTDDAGKFITIGSKFLGYQLQDVKKIDITQ